MKHNYKSLQQVIDVLKSWDILGWTEIADKLWKSRVVVHKYLKELVKSKKIKKIGKPPHTKYKIVDAYRNISTSWNKASHNVEYKSEIFSPDFKTRKTLDEIFYKFSPDGSLLEGLKWMKLWCANRNLDIKEKSDNYISIYNHIVWLQDSCGLLSAKESFWKYFDGVYMDEIYYGDQYKWMEFGRWKLAEMTFYAKQSQNKALITQAISEIFPKLECIIDREWFDAIAITPWSIDRKNQLLGLLKNELKTLWLPFVNITKYYPNNIPIPQKSLKSREARIQNARNTIIVDDDNISEYDKVFLIDDFVWSWSTLNETAHKLILEWVNKVIGFAFVWNLNLEYDIINEV